MSEREQTAIALLKCALAWEPDVCLVGNVCARSIAKLAASLVTRCPTCGAEPWVNIDCELCAVCAALEVGRE